MYICGNRIAASAVIMWDGVSLKRSGSRIITTHSDRMGDPEPVELKQEVMLDTVLSPGL